MTLGLLVAVGCASGSYEVGPDATREIKDVMRAGVGGEAALLAGEDAYLFDPGALEKERRALLGVIAAKRIYYGLGPDELARYWEALAAKDRQTLETFRDRFEPAEFAEMLASLDRKPVRLDADGDRPSTGVHRFYGQRVLEIAYPDGVLRVARYEGLKIIGPRFSVAYTRSKRGFGHSNVVYARFATKATPGIEAAWRNLERAAAARWDYSVPLDGTGPFQQSALGTTRKLAREEFDGWIELKEG